MISVTCSRPFSELGDQQLLEQTRRLAANQRCLDVHIVDHLHEIDRRGLALRRGFSSLFDYAVRELRFTDAAAQRRIQAMRLCRRHGWVRASLQSGELSMTAAAQLETTFAGAERAERAERQWRTGRRNVGRDTRCRGSGRAGSARKRILAAGAEPDGCLKAEYEEDLLQVYFQLILSEVATSALTVTVNVTETGAMRMSSDPVHQVTVASGQQAKSFPDNIVDDTVDEPDSVITATIQPGTGYQVGIPASASITVLDND